MDGVITRLNFNTSVAIIDQVLQFWNMNGIDILCFFMKYVRVDVEIKIIPIVMKLINLT